MQHRHAQELDAVNPGSLGQRLQLHAGAVGISGLRRKGVIVDVLQHRRRLRRCIERNRPALAKDRKAERAQIVHAQNVVGVGVGIKHRVHARQAGAQGLLAEVRAGVDDHHPLRSAVFGPFQRTSTEGRSRRSCGSAEVHTAQAQPSVGTPIEVPVPRNVSRPSILSF